MLITQASSVKERESYVKDWNKRALGLMKACEVLNKRFKSLPISDSKKISALSQEINVKLAERKTLVAELNQTIELLVGALPFQKGILPILNNMAKATLWADELISRSVCFSNNDPHLKALAKTGSRENVVMASNRIQAPVYNSSLLSAACVEMQRKDCSLEKLWPMLEGAFSVP